MGTGEKLIEVVLPGVVEPEDLLVRERDVPAPGAGEVLVRMEATGISFAEQQMRRDRYYDQPPYPFVPGYDLVGTVIAVGPGADPALRGRRVAALTKIGGWRTHTVLAAADVVPVPAGVSAAQAETVVVSGITAWQMLHRLARVRAGQTVVVLGANGSVGSILAQLARRAGARVIGSASARHQDTLRAAGVEPVDYRGDLTAQVGALAPGGVDAVFDHVGGPGIAASWRLLRRGGTLVGYGSASTRDDTGNRQLPVLKLLPRVWAWNLLPNGRHAYFYNIWAGARRKDRFRAQLHADLTAVLEVMAAGELTAPIAAELPLTRAAEAMRLAESRTVVGKVVLTP
ncbi:medium chain dehydrogenase/reductase family protein [Actinoplanes sp. N902-109]|uniref:medium chain dehydrogenase/reductase family protein n=1 Tax=Actinoplanes sp. (strain N902-109) TaxID=649831 RepID=UPI0003293F1E|nr:medium chain dehydrogenase/reductase family protein [Actinoplanes sp. N902-109]AGL18710.1 putative zinc-binding oxidoreductase [Actinoplanes sp. N902-109]